MKSKTIFSAIIMLTVSHLASANCQVQFDSEADRVLHLGGDTLRGNFATKAQCQAYQNSRPAFEQNHSYCVGCDDRSDSGSKVTPPGSSSGNRRGRGGNAASEAEQEKALKESREAYEAEQERTRKEQAEKEKREAFDRGQNELRTGLKGGTSTSGTGLKTGTTLPLKGSGSSQPIGLKTYDAAAKEKTIKAIKELNCSAYWGLKAASAALGGKNEVTTNLEDKYTLARQYGEYSAMAKDGKTVSGCPEVKISIPDVPPPVDANPQIKLYSHIIKQTGILVPDIIETRQKVDVANNRLKKIEKDIAVKRLEIKQFDKKFVAIKKEEEIMKLQEKKEEKILEQDELLKQALELKEEAVQLQKKADDQGKSVNDLQGIYDAVNKNPRSAEELLKR